MHSAAPARVRTAGPPTSVLLAGWAATAAFVLLLWVTFAGGPPDPLDRHLFGWVHGSPGTAETGFAKHLTMIGDGVPLIATLLVLGVLARVVWHRWEPLAVTALAVALAGTTSTVVKLAAGRDRPPASGWMSSAAGNSFPSGHTTVATAGYLTLAAAVAVLTTSARARAVVLGSAFGLVQLIGWTRVELGVHWPTDVFAGWAIGTGAACAAMACWQLGPLTLRP
jgi:undecaprenyl-diphosphatase